MKKPNFSLENLNIFLKNHITQYKQNIRKHLAGEKNLEME